MGRVVVQLFDGVGNPIEWKKAESSFAPSPPKTPTADRAVLAGPGNWSPEWLDARAKEQVAAVMMDWLAWERYQAS